MSGASQLRAMRVRKEALEAIYTASHEAASEGRESEETFWIALTDLVENRYPSVMFEIYGAKIE